MTAAPRLTPNPVRFLDRTWTRCAWILDAEAPIEERMCCGARVERGSYCAFHHDKAYQKPVPKRLREAA